MNRMQAESYANEHNMRSRTGVSYVAERGTNHGWYVVRWDNGRKTIVAGEENV